MTAISKQVALCLAASVCATSASAQSIDDLRNMSIDDLANIDVSSVTKSRGSLLDAPAAIYVISHDDIARSGASSVPEILRLAPNLDVIRTGASTYVITARGLSGNNAAQNFSNKLLVLIDGRSVYTPLYSGVYWDMQDVLPEDVDRIEVISGPGATLWGANAVNGVINIITRNSGATQGAFGTIGGGNQTRDAGARFGGRIGGDATYRFYVKAHQDRHSDTGAGADADDKAHIIQGGFRVDWNPGTADSFTVQGDAYGGARAQGTAPDERTEGRNLLGRWNRTWAGGSTLQVQTYYDHAARTTENSDAGFAIDTFDLDIQQNFALGHRNDLVVGGGARLNKFHITGAGGLDFVPANRSLWLSNIYVQDSITLFPALTAILGIKLEDDPFSGATLLPSARLSWKVGPQFSLWAAASRAVRSPTPFDTDVTETSGSTLFLTGNRNFRSEKLTAYETGLRVQAGSRASLSISGFYNVYDDLRSIELTPVTFLPLIWGNLLRGHTYGFDAWGSYQVTPWWKLSAAFSLLRENFRFKPSSSGLLGISQLGDDPKHRASIRSSFELTRNISLDADLRYVSARPDPFVKHYIELGGRVGWALSRHLELGVSGANLLHERHLEFPASGATAVPRSFFIDLKWRT